MSLISKLISKAKAEYKLTLRMKEDALGRTLGQELVREGVILSKVAVNASQALLNRDLVGVVKAVLASTIKEDKEMDLNALITVVKPMVAKAVEKGIKSAVQAAVAVLMGIASQGAVGHELVLDPVSTQVALTALSYGVLESIRTTVKRVLTKKKMTTLASLL